MCVGAHVSEGGVSVREPKSLVDGQSEFAGFDRWQQIDPHAAIDLADFFGAPGTEGDADIIDAFHRMQVEVELALHAAEAADIHALYGRGYADTKSLQFGGPNSKDVALRCAYYGRAPLSLQEMKAGYARDKYTYLPAGLSNEHIILNPKQRELFEQRQLRGEMLISKYIRNFEFIKKKKPYLPRRVRTLER
jgi:hypothetical protein